MNLELGMPSTPHNWGQSLSGPPILDKIVGGAVPSIVRRWRGIAPGIDQAALDHHFISVHLGGAKRLHRRGEGKAEERVVRPGAYSVVPAGSAFHWETEGPVDFAHFYFDPKIVDHVVASAFDRNPSYIQVEETLGDADAMITAMAFGLLDELASDDRQQSYVEDMLHLLLCRMLRLNSNARRNSPLARHVLAPFRLRRSLDFIEANLGKQIGVEDIAAASGVSRFHFSRAFRETTGSAPYAFLLGRRIALAKMLLINSAQPLADISSQSGFTSLSQFSRMFKRETGVCPSSFRQRQ